MEWAHMIILHCYHTIKIILVTTALLTKIPAKNGNVSLLSPFLPLGLFLCLVMLHMCSS